MALSSTLSAVLLVVLFSSSWFSLSECHRGKAVGVGADQREFDYFLLSLQWPGTVCHGTRKCCASNGCCRSNGISDFTIHGLWTDYNDGTWPQCCNNGEKFDIKQIKPLMEGLQKYWPSLRCGSTSTCHGVKGLFWAHEWEKHGTCSYPVFRDEYNYFLATLNLYLKYNVTEILGKEGYVPSNTEKYPLGGIVSAIQNTFRATPELVCKNGALDELHLCFFKNFEPRDCNLGRNKLSSRSCPKYVSLPKYMPMSLGSTTMPWLSDHQAL